MLNVCGDGFPPRAIIPDRLLGRVNSVYRFFGLGDDAIGVLSVERWLRWSPNVDSEWAPRRSSWLRFCGIVGIYAIGRLSQSQIEAARKPPDRLSVIKEYCFQVRSSAVSR